MNFLKDNWIAIVAGLAVSLSFFLYGQHQYGRGDTNGYERASTEWSVRYLALVQAKTTTTTDTTKKKTSQAPIGNKQKDTTSLKLADKAKIDSAFVVALNKGLDSLQKEYERVGAPAHWTWNFGDSPIDSERVSADIWYFPLTRDWEPKIYLPPLVEVFINTHDRILAVEVRKDERSFLEETSPYFIGAAIGVVVYVLAAR